MFPSPNGQIQMICQQEDYEIKRKWEFQPSWKKEFTWLSYDAGKNEMFCSVCRRFPQLADASNPFVKGTSSFRKDPVKTHDKSKHHKKCSLLILLFS